MNDWSENKSVTFFGQSPFSVTFFGALATKALAHKLARAAYYVMRDRVAFDDRRLFG